MVISQQLEGEFWDLFSWDQRNVSNRLAGAPQHNGQDTELV